MSTAFVLYNLDVIYLMTAMQHLLRVECDFTCSVPSSKVVDSVDEAGVGKVCLQQALDLGTCDWD